MLRYGRGTKTYNVVNSSINNSKNLPHEAFDKLFDPVVKKINEKSILTREIDTVLDQELTVELARMLGGKFYGTGEDRRPYLIVDSSAARKSANLILAKYESINFIQEWGSCKRLQRLDVLLLLSIWILKTGLESVVF